MNEPQPVSPVAFGDWASHRAAEHLGLASKLPEPTVRSRRLLVEVVRALGPFRDSLVVVGAHAVMHHAEKLGFQPDSTADADAALNPLLVADSPSILHVMREAGLEPASPERPGIYGYAGESQIPQRQRTTIDLIVPESYAGAGRRAARVSGQKNALTRALGIELSLWDRDSTTISTLPDDQAPLSAPVAVAGAGALLVAKAHKIGDRLAELESKPHRLRPKDSKDIGLLMLASDPKKVADRLGRAVGDHPETLDICRTGMRFIIGHYRSDARDGLVRSHLIESLDDVPSISDAIDTWMDAFQAQASWLRD